ncbi:hypothetical protein BJ742DRAFT_502949 [Cladochytrium replicatum]|nr:hypothetical protein BJ742DRAFT_502949 [Cladochytrium replicatum]
MASINQMLGVDLDDEDDAEDWFAGQPSTENSTSPKPRSEKMMAMLSQRNDEPKNNDITRDQTKQAPSKTHTVIPRVNPSEKTDSDSVPQQDVPGGDKPVETADPLLMIPTQPKTTANRTGSGRTPRVRPMTQSSAPVDTGSFFTSGIDTVDLTTSAPPKIRPSRGSRDETGRRIGGIARTSTSAGGAASKPRDPLPDSERQDLETSLPNPTSVRSAVGKSKHGSTMSLSFKVFDDLKSEQGVRNDDVARKLGGAERIGSAGGGKHAQESVGFNVVDLAEMIDRILEKMEVGSFLVNVQVFVAPEMRTGGIRTSVYQTNMDAEAVDNLGSFHSVRSENQGPGQPEVSLNDQAADGNHVPDVQPYLPLQPLDLPANTINIAVTRETADSLSTLPLTKLKLQTHQAMVTELGRRIHRFQKTTTSLNSRIESLEKENLNLLSTIETLQKSLEESKAVVEQTRENLRIAEQAIVDAVADAAAEASAAAYAQIRVEREKEHRRKESRETAQSSPVQVWVPRPKSPEGKEDVVVRPTSGERVRFAQPVIEEEVDHDSVGRPVVESTPLDPFDPASSPSEIESEITKDMIIDAARMLSAKKRFDPPSTLGVGLQSAGDEESNPYRHVQRWGPNHLQSTTFRAPHITRLARRVADRHHHLTTVLAQQTQELLATNSPDEYIRTLHAQLDSMTRVVHDCIDALAEEQRATDIWRRRFERVWKRFVGGGGGGGGMRRRRVRRPGEAVCVRKLGVGRRGAGGVDPSWTMGMKRKQYLVNCLIPYLQSAGPRERAASAVGRGERRAQTAMRNPGRSSDSAFAGGNKIRSAKARLMTTPPSTRTGNAGLDFSRNGVGESIYTSDGILIHSDQPQSIFTAGNIGRPQRIPDSVIKNNIEQEDRSLPSLVSDSAVVGKGRAGSGRSTHGGRKLRIVMPAISSVIPFNQELERSGSGRMVGGAVTGQPHIATRASAFQQARQYLQNLQVF